MGAGLRAQARLVSKRLAGKTVPGPGGCLRCGIPWEIRSNQRAIPTGRTFFSGDGLDVGAVQRGGRPEAVEHDADRAAIAAGANDDPFPAGEIRASHRAERAHPDSGRWRQPRPLFGRLRRRSRRTENHRGTHPSVTIVPSPSPPCPCRQAVRQIRPTPRPRVHRRSAGPARAANRATSGPTARSPVRSPPAARR